MNLHFTTLLSAPESGSMPDDPKRCTVILVHGFFRTRRDMAFLHRGLKHHGYKVISVELPITLGDINKGVEELGRQLKKHQLHGKNLAFVAHSMGGLVVRTFIAQMNKRHPSPHRSIPLDIKRCIFIATPHKGTPLADIALSVPGLKFLFKALPDLCCTAEHTWSAPLLHASQGGAISSEIKIGLIAGTSASLLPGRFLISGDNDGMVPQSSAITPDADAVMLLSFSHVTIHKRKATLTAVTHFLSYAQFPPGT